MYRNSLVRYDPAVGIIGTIAAVLVVLWLIHQFQKPARDAQIAAEQARDTAEKALLAATGHDAKGARLDAERAAREAECAARGHDWDYTKPAGCRRCYMDRGQFDGLDPKCPDDNLHDWDWEGEDDDDEVPGIVNCRRCDAWRNLNDEKAEAVHEAFCAANGHTLRQDGSKFCTVCGEYEDEDGDGDDDDQLDDQLLAEVEAHLEESKRVRHAAGVYLEGEEDEEEDEGDNETALAKAKLELEEAQARIDNLEDKLAGIKPDDGEREDGAST